jgi:2EXR family
MSTFHHFSGLPKEIRLQIWKYAMPPPRLIEFRFINKEDPSIRDHYGWFRKGDWTWKTSSAPHPSLLGVSSEARKVVLEFYRCVSICDKKTRDSVRIYIDFERDTILLPRLAFDCLVDIVEECNRRVREYLVPGWASSIRNVAIITQGHRSVLRDLTMSPFVGLFAASDKAKWQQSDVNFLVSVFEHFPRLKWLLLVIDGRMPDTGAPFKLVEPTAAYEDRYEENGRSKALDWVQQLQHDLRAKGLTPRDICVELSLLINGEDTPELERRWDYYHACCRFYAPGYEGHRSYSESPPLPRSSGDEGDSDDWSPSANGGFSCLLRDVTTSDED